MTKALAGAAGLGVVLYLTGLALHAPLLCLLAKPVPVLALAIAVLGRDQSGFGRAVGTGLLLSAVGDVLLEWSGGFVAGLGAFLLAHLAYAYGFLRDEPRLRLLRAAPFAGWLAGASVLFFSGVPAPLRLPVVVYVGAIGLMMWRAAARVGDDRAGAWAGLLGAVLFGLSDMLIAFDRFHAPIPGVGYPVILLYWAGQAGIALSVLRRRSEPQQPVAALA